MMAPHDDEREIADVGQALAPPARDDDQPASSTIERRPTGQWMWLIAVKEIPPCCWRAACIAGSTAGVYFFDDAVGVPDPVDHAFAGVDTSMSCAAVARHRGFELQRRIIGRLSSAIVLHLVAEAGKAAELVEQLLRRPRTTRRRRSAAGCCRRRAAAGVGAMLVEISLRRCRPAACGRTTARSRPASRRAGRATR